MSRIAHDSGVGIIRPMYYDFPEEAQAYPSTMEHNLGQEPSTSQFFFGDAMLVAPVTAPAQCGNSTLAERAATERANLLGEVQSGGATVVTGVRASDAPCGLTEMDVWIPPGTWYEHHTGRVRSGPTTVSLNVHLLDVPIYSLLGATVARKPLGSSKSLIGGAAMASPALEWTIYPGPGWPVSCAAKGESRIYEDDGETYRYLPCTTNATHGNKACGEHAWTTLKYKTHVHWGVSVLEATISTSGHFPALPSTRSHTIRLPSSMPPLKVSTSG